MKIHESLPWRRLSPSDGHYFFGYYDRCPWDASQAFHLALKAPQCERLPRPGERAEIGLLRRDGSSFEPLASTRCWCHQQGSMTLWLKHRPGAFIYNDYDEAEGRMAARVFELGKGEIGRYDMPIYAISPDGRWGATLNFSRIPRRGYSYADATLEEARHPDLDRDGLFLVDLHSGAVKLLVSYRTLFAAHPVPYDLEDMYVWMNHIIFNCDSTRILFLFRHCYNKFSPGNWRTHMFTVGVDGEGLLCPLPQFYWSNMISHQIWGRTPREVLIDANWRGQGSEYVVFDERTLPLRAERVSKGMGPMGHLVFSPDGEWMLADTYPDASGFQRLALVKCSSGELREIGRFGHFQPAGTSHDVRCDLHPRWSQDGSLITVDSIHSGMRSVFMLEFDAGLKALFQR